MVRVLLLAENKAENIKKKGKGIFVMEVLTVSKICLPGYRKPKGYNLICFVGCHDLQRNFVIQII